MAEMIIEIDNIYDKDDVLDFAIAIIGANMWRFEEEVEERQEDQIFDLIDSIMPEPPIPWIMEWGRQLYKIITLMWSITPQPPYPYLR